MVDLQKIETQTEDNPDSYEDQEDNIYVYEEEEEEAIENDMDTSALNLSQMSEEEWIEAEAALAEHQSKVSVFKILLMVLSNPVEGWKEVRRKRISVENAQVNCFYPLLAIMAISHFATLFYTARVTLSEVIMSAVTSFVGYFAGYFCIVILLKMLLPTAVKNVMDSDFGKVFVILNLSSLCLFFTATELLPMLWPVLIFLPLWTVYVICRGTRFFKFPEDKTIFCTGLLCLLIIGVPLLIEWALNEVLPGQV